ncbi:MAG: MMPL family transporter [Dehalococcoidia bacterium]
MTTTQPSHADNSWLARWARFAYRRRILVALAWVAALVAVIAVGSRFGGDFGGGFEVPGSEAQRAINVLEERFPARAGAQATLVFKAEAGVTAPGIRERIEGVVARIAASPGVASVDDPFEEGSVSPDGTIARALVFWPQEDVKREAVEPIFDIVDEASGDGLQVEIGGSIVQNFEREPPNSELLGLIAASFILIVAFGSVVAAGLPLGAALFGLGVSFGLLWLGANSGQLPDFTPQFAAMIGIGVGIDYSLLVVTRFREALHAGKSTEDAVVQTVTTAGRAVIFAGAVVAISLIGLFAMGLPFVAGMGATGAVVVGISVLVAVTLTPAVLGFVGPRIDRLRLPVLHAREGVNRRSVWFRLSDAIQRQPLPYFLGTTALLVLLAAPVLDMRLGFTDAGNFGEQFRVRRAYDLLAEGFGPGFNGPLLVVVDANGGELGPLDAIRSRLQEEPGVAAVSQPLVNPAGDAATITVFPATSPQSEETEQLIHRLRDEVIPSMTGNPSPVILVSGSTAMFIDIGDRIGQRLPFLFAGVIGLSFLLLTAVFRSVVIAVKAAILNLFSIGASFGVLVAIFQWGWFADFVGIREGPIETFLPMMLFAIVFGLSMDYEVFLISRIREEYLRTGDTAIAVNNGLAVTARVITAAALIMVTVFLSFALSDQRVIKEFGIGLATAIFVDATIVRLLLVPSAMRLLGERNWWLPAWLDRLLPHIVLESAPPASPMREESSAAS